jgi:hypothetical protein
MISAQKMFSLLAWTHGSVESAGGNSKTGLEELLWKRLADAKPGCGAQTPISAIPPTFIISRRENVDILHTSLLCRRQKRQQGAAVYIWAGKILNSIVVCPLSGREAFFRDPRNGE